MKGRLKSIPSHLIVAISAWGNGIVTMLAQIINVRIMLAGLGKEGYAAFMVLSSLTGWYLLADLGIGYSVQNYISEHRAREADYRKYIAVALLAGMLLLLGALTLVAVISPYLGPLLLRRFHGLSPSEKTSDFLMVSLLFTVAGVAGIGQRVWYALHRGYLYNLLSALASLLTLGAIVWIFSIYKGQPEHRLLLSLIAFAAPPALMALISVISIIRTERVPGEWNADVARDLFKRGSKFWIGSLVAAGVLMMDPIVMSQVLHGSDIVVYSLTVRIFASAYLMYSAALQALWPLSTELIARHEWHTVMRQSRNYLLAGTIFMLLVTIAFIGFEPWIMRLLSPHVPISIPVALILTYGAYQLAGVWTGAFATILQSMSDMRPFIVWGAVQALLSGPLQWVFATHIGVCGIPLGLLSSYLLTAAWALPLRVRDHVRRLQPAC